MLPILNVVAAVISDGECFLACRRRQGLNLGGFWEFPGGKVEDEEPLEEAIRREIREELNCDIRVIGELWRDDTIQGNRVIRLICMQAEIKGPPPISSIDHDELRWVRLSEMASMRWAGPDLPAVTRLVGDS